jgi:hypothetical protein
VRRIIALGLLAAAVLAAGAYASFSATRSTPQTISAVHDFLPPAASAAQIVGEGGAIGNVSPGRSYRVYAHVTDQGNPPVGVGSVVADVSSISGPGAVATLTPGSYTVGSQSFNYGSADVRAAANLTPGSKPYSLTMADALEQSATQSFSVNSGPQCEAESLTTDNGGHPHVVDRDDEIFYTFTTAIDPSSIISYWTSGGVGVTILIADHGTSDELTIVNQSTGHATPLGVVAMDGDFAHGDVRFGGVIQMQGSDTAVVRITDLYGGTGQPVTEATKQTMTWSPTSGIRDTAGNPCSTTSVTQPKPIHNF